MQKIYISVLFFSLLVSRPIEARTCHLPDQWKELCPVLQSRVSQKKPKMKLNEPDAQSLEEFLKAAQSGFPHLNSLQALLPKTTVELLMSVHKRGVPPQEAEMMAAYLKKVVEAFQFQNKGAFDENTSHIIGREWHEIDYSGEGMTWQKQKAYYAPHGIHHFKSQRCLERFFRIESKLPYFRKGYKPLKAHPNL